MPPELLEQATIGALALAGLWFVAKQLKGQYEERINNYKLLITRFEEREIEGLNRERALYERLVKSGEKENITT